MIRTLRLAAALLVPSLLTAQVSTADEGSFTVTRGEAKIGREEFRIVRQPAGGGVEYVARALAAYGDRRISPALQTDDAGAPLRYQVEVRSATGVDERLTGQAEGIRFRAQVRTPRGEAAREYILGEGSVLADDDLYHQLYFLSLAARGGGAASRRTMLMPRRNAHGPATVERAGAETVVIAGRALAATKLVVTPSGGARREVWVDAAGRVLKVSVPDERIVALRDDPPAGPLPD
jgi:hypothetical protein